MRRLAWGLFPALWLAGCSVAIHFADEPWLSGFAGGMALCCALFVFGQYAAGDL